MISRETRGSLYWRGKVYLIMTMEQCSNSSYRTLTNRLVYMNIRSGSCKTILIRCPYKPKGAKLKSSSDKKKKCSINSKINIQNN